MLLITPPEKILGHEVNTSYKKWLRFGALWDSKLLLQEKIFLSYRMVLGFLPPDGESQKWLEAIMRFYTCGESSNGTPPKERLLDWERDSAAVWGDFKVYMGVDLDDCQNMHWWKFMALLESLPRDSQIKQRISTRAIDLSKIKDSETRAEYEKQKRLVALDPIDDEWW